MGMLITLAMPLNKSNTITTIRTSNLIILLRKYPNLESLIASTITNRSQIPRMHLSTCISHIPLMQMPFLNLTRLSRRNSAFKRNMICISCHKDQRTMMSSSTILLTSKTWMSQFLWLLPQQWLNPHIPVFISLNSNHRFKRNSQTISQRSNPISLSNAHLLKCRLILSHLAPHKINRTSHISSHIWHLLNQVRSSLSNRSPISSLPSTIRLYNRKATNNNSNSSLRWTKEANTTPHPQPTSIICQQTSHPQMKKSFIRC